MAACAVLNGFGKTMGLVQVEEMGTIETPILMTNTLSIGTAATALIEYMLRQSCAAWTSYCNEVCSDLDEARRQRLTELFRTASAHELYFWEMAGGKQ